ncbi:PspC domain-containing protein [Nigerium massiliense]|uniref:PspC domain-containing protein n=1 Tax=Nigerium massiliense TaxID=1522317 RepID=UPI001C464965|nr:PspC domain-containing protein [Nigerium massiliense]
MPAARRPHDDRVVAGVCSGLARSWSVDPLLVRIAWVIAVLASSGTLLLAYAALWVLLPEDGTDRRLPDAIAGWSATKLVLVVCVPVALAGLVIPGLGPGFTAIAVAALLVWYINRRINPTPPAGGGGHSGSHVAPHHPGPGAPYVDTSAPRQYPDDTIPLPPQRPVPGPRPRPRARSARGWLLIGVGCAAVWTALGVAAAAGVRVTALAWWSATLLMLGVALLISARRRGGRPAGLLSCSVVVAVVTACTLASTADPAPRVAENDVRTYASGQELAERQELPVGTHVLDLRQLTLQHDAVSSVSLGAGELTVLLPRNANVEVHGTVDIGELVAPAHVHSGLDNDAVVTSTPNPGGPTLVLNATVDTGRLVIVR